MLRSPVDCTLGETCHIQNYVDHLPTQAARDFRCGGLTYDGHKGTDFAVPTLAEMRAGVAVVAAAPGTVRGVRDEMPDQRFDPKHPDAVSGRECGNGVVVAHSDGWETQYCHMRRGSIRVAPGDHVVSGTVLGQIGLSGKTQFPHLHLSVRKDGRPVDPFAPENTDDCAAPAHDLWEYPIEYEDGGLLSAGFTDAIPDYDTVLDGTAARTTLATTAPALVLFGHAFGGRKGDIIRLTVSGPQGMVFTQDAILEKAQAQLFRATGRRLSAPRWPEGDYDGVVEMVRDGQTIGRKSVTVRIR